MQNKNRQRRWCFILFSLITLISFSSDFEEKIEVKERIFSRDLRSKNMIIISAEKINSLAIKNFTDLFSFFTALNVSRRGPDESSYDLSMRGCHFEQVLLLLDGIPLNNPQTGHFNTDFPFTINDIERVEIIRGGSSTTYGSGAFAGVINFILKKKEAGAVILSVGSNGFFSGELSWGKVAQKFNYSLSAKRSNSRGYYPGREFDRLQLQGNASFTFSKNRLEFLSGYLDKDFGAEGFYEAAPSIENSQTAFFTIKLQRTNVHSRYQLGYAQQDHRDYFILDRYQPDLFRNRSRTQGQFLYISSSHDWRSFHLATGAELKKEILYSTAMGDWQRDRAALYLNATYSTADTSIDFGIRNEFHAAAEDAFIFNAGYAHRFSDRLSANINLSRSLRLPTFTELHYRSPKNVGDPGLQPETSFNYEASLIWFGPTRNVDLSFFYRRQLNTIDWIRFSAGDAWRAVNLRKNDLLGTELTQQWIAGNIQLLAAIEKIWVLAEQDSFQSKYGLRFPDFSLKANLAWKLARNVTVAGNYLYKHLFRTTENGHFLNAVFSYQLRKWQFSLRWENIFNSIIEEIPGIAVDGRRLYFGFAYR